MKQIKLKNEVISIFQNFTEKEFTVRQALDAYMESPFSTQTDLKNAHQFIQRCILKFVANGDLVKTSTEGRSHKYRTTDRFNSYIFESKTIPINSKRCISTNKQSIKENLTERLHHQKLQLLTSLGETEEYDAIYKEMPEIQKQIQTLYNESRDKCSKLLGKVKAIESLILLSTE